MTRKYKVMKLAMPTWDNFAKKKKKMEDLHYSLYGKKKNIPMTKVVMACSQKEIYINDLELKQLTKRRVFNL